MKVKCINDTGINISEKLFSYGGWNKEMTFNEVRIGKIYVVYAILIIEDQCLYMICGEDYDGNYVKYPDLLPASLFEVVDERKSKFWLTRTKNGRTEFGFKELFENEYFYGELVEGYENEEKIFSLVKEKMDQENKELNPKDRDN